MASCPNCGRKLKITDFKPECPGCGVNLLFYNNDERLMDEAEKAEAEHAVFQKKLDRMKASYVGSKLTVARIVLYVLPLVFLLLPLFSLTNADTVRSVNLITLYNHIETLDINGAISYLSGGTAAQSAYTVALLAVVLSVLFDLLGLIFITMAGGKLGNIRNIIFGVLTVACGAVSFVFLGKFLAEPSGVVEYASGKTGFGAYLYLAGLVACLIINVVIAAKGNEVNYTVCFVGGIPEDEYFTLKESGISKEEMRKKMKEAIAKIERENEEKVAALTKPQ
ncbi:MAG: hypothetical protein MJ177_00965 [Clostridia bacterium]|nr:hypothetical protein [Clostridia bacterium]